MNKKNNVLLIVFVVLFAAAGALYLYLERDFIKQETEPQKPIGYSEEYRNKDGEIWRLPDEPRTEFSVIAEAGKYPRFISSMPPNFPIFVKEIDPIFRQLFQLFV